MASYRKTLEFPEVEDTPSPLGFESQRLVGEGWGEGYLKDSKTTEIYTHVSTKSLGKIMSPLDTLELSKGGDE